MNTNLKDMAREVRCDVIGMIGHLGVGHIGGCLSVVELLAVLSHGLVLPGSCL